MEEKTNLLFFYSNVERIGDGIFLVFGKFFNSNTKYVIET